MCARSRSLKPRRSRAASRSRTTWLIGYGDSDSSSSSTASVAAHSASPSVTMLCASVGQLDQAGATVGRVRDALDQAGPAHLGDRLAHRGVGHVALGGQRLDAHRAEPGEPHERHGEPRPEARDPRVDVHLGDVRVEPAEQQPERPPAVLLGGVGGRHPETITALI